jgi:hypothetical protein
MEQHSKHAVITIIVVVGIAAASLWMFKPPIQTGASVSFTESRDWHLKNVEAQRDDACRQLAELQKQIQAKENPDWPYTNRTGDVRWTGMLFVKEGWKHEFGFRDDGVVVVRKK